MQLQLLAQMKMLILATMSLKKMLSAESAFVELGEGSETLKMECSCNKIFSSEKHQTASEHGGANQNDQENQEHPNIMGVHGECLAIAFALLNTEIGFDILVMKNLRICIVNALVMIIGDWSDWTNDSNTLAVKLIIKMETVFFVCSRNLEAGGNMVQLCFHQVLGISAEPNLRSHTREPNLHHAEKQRM